MEDCIYESSNDLIAALASELEYLGNSARDNSKVAHIALSGGSTPKALFKFISSSDFSTRICWSKIHFWWGDERCVSPNDPESNYGQTRALLLDHIDIPEENIHRIQGEKDPVEEAGRFARELKARLPMQNGRPQFDWVVLGIGEDGHTASLFPGRTDYHADADSVVAVHPSSHQQRISLTAPVISTAKRVTYLALGTSKSDIVSKIVSPEESSKSSYPAAKIRSYQGVTEIYMDSYAAERLIKEQ